MKYLLSFILLTGCAQFNKQDTSFETDQFNDFYDEFMAEASKRGFEFTFKTLEISIDHNEEFTGKDGVLGKCIRNNDSDGGKILLIKIHPHAMATHYIYAKELIFHELGHCLLGRPHLEDSFEDGNKKSIMAKDGAQIQMLFLEKNFNYYLDELFDPKFKTL